jgi:hypothetical protein
MNTLSEETQIVISILKHNILASVSLNLWSAYALLFILLKSSTLMVWRTMLSLCDLLTLSISVQHRAVGMPHYTHIITMVPVLTIPVAGLRPQPDCGS